MLIWGLGCGGISDTAKSCLRLSLARFLDEDLFSKSENNLLAPKFQTITIQALATSHVVVVVAAVVVVAVVIKLPVV